MTIEITKSIGFEENELSLPFQKGSSTYYVTTKEKSIAEQLESDGFGKIVSTYQGGGKVAKSYLHLYKLTYPNGEYTVEAYDGDYMTPKEALEKMRISLRGLKSYKYSGASSDSANYKKWHHKKDIGYSNTEAWDEVFGSEKYAKGGSTYAEGGEIKEFNNFKDYVREMENDEHEKYIISTTDMYLKDRDWKSKPFESKQEFESFKDYVREMENDEHEQYFISTIDMYVNDRDWSSTYQGGGEIESNLNI
jgi:hypothetical protein